MNEIITKLNEIEEKAEAIISDARTGKDRMISELDAAQKAVDDRYDQMEAQTAGELEQRLRKEGEEQLDRMRKENASSIRRMAEAFDREREKMAQAVFERLIQA